MHDLHAANLILKQALAYAQKNNLKKITKIKLELGEIEEHGEMLSPDNLKFNLMLLTKNTMAQDAEVEIKKISGDNFVLKEIEGVR